MCAAGCCCSIGVGLLRLPSRAYRSIPTFKTPENSLLKLTLPQKTRVRVLYRDAVWADRAVITRGGDFELVSLATDLGVGITEVYRDGFLK